MNSYTLSISKSHIYLSILVPVVILLSILAFILSLFYDNTASGIGVGLLLAAFAFLNWKKFLHKPVEIDITNGKAIFRDIFKKESEIPLSDILKIEVDNSKSLRIITKSTEFIGVYVFNNIEEFVSDIKNNNPALVTVGL